jgi:glycosyltransferase involved in cell wall biosynthesis
MGSIIYPMASSKMRMLSDIRRVWGANVQEQRFLSKLKKYIDIEIVEMPELEGIYATSGFYTDFFNDNDISLMFAPPDSYHLRYYVPNTPAIISSIHSVGIMGMIYDFISNAPMFEPEYDRFIVGSNDAMHAIKKISDKYTGIIQPTYGVDTEIFDNIKREPAEIKEIYGIPKNDKVLLYLGRISEQKNIFDLLRIFRIVHTKMPRTSLLLVGPIDPLRHPSHIAILQKEIQKTLAQLNIADSVFLTAEREKFVRPKDIADVVNCGDIFLYPTLYAQETRGIAPIEASYLGMPVVATAWDGLKETVAHGESGYLVDVYKTDNYPVMDFYQFTNYVVHLLKNPKKAELMGKRAQEIAQKFTMQSIAKSTAEKMRVLVEKFENRKNDPPDGRSYLDKKPKEIFSGVKEPYRSIINGRDVNEFIYFHQVVDSYDLKKRVKLTSLLWRTIEHYGNKDITDIDIEKYTSFGSTTRIIVQPFSEIKVMKIVTLALSYYPYWMLPLSNEEWQRFFEIFNEIDNMPVLAPETKSDYKIVSKLVNMGFLLPLIEPSDY